MAELEACDFATPVAQREPLRSALLAAMVEALEGVRKRFRPPVGGET